MTLHSVDVSASDVKRNPYPLLSGASSGALFIGRDAAASLKARGRLIGLAFLPHKRPVSGCYLIGEHKVSVAEVANVL